MTIEECYKAMDADFDSTILRLKTRERVQKFAVMFLGDETYAQFKEAFETKDYKEAFRAVHTLKGVSLNFGFTRLFDASVELTEALRDGYTPKAEEIVENLDRAYNKIITAIKQLD